MVASLARLLADGEFHSGSEMAASFGISRAAVWKRVVKLRELGIDVQAVTGRGYRVPGGIDLLDRDRILCGLPAEVRAACPQLDVFDVVDSTNAVAMSRGRVARGHYVCLAEMQTAGRGRRGRTWVSPYGANIYLSLAREFPGGYAAIEGLSVAVGVSVCSALRAMGADALGVKWPNDIVLAERKVGGILIELVGDLSGSFHAVIGVGLNVWMGEAAAQGIEQPWACLPQCGVDKPRNEIVAGLLGALLPALDRFERHGLSPFLPAWDSMDACRGRRVTLVGADAAIQQGVALGVDETGGLRVDTDHGVRVFRGGEVSLRRGGAT